MSASTAMVPSREAASAGAPLTPFHARRESALFGRAKPPSGAH
ncbi:hypothetical protein [Burkholderia latens]|nr:hypothetical protein [Burkholderia latens]